MLDTNVKVSAYNRFRQERTTVFPFQHLLHQLKSFSPPLPNLFVPYDGCFSPLYGASSV